MSGSSDCCDTSLGGPLHAACPVTGTRGTRVRLQTVKAILRDVSLRRLVPTTYYFCSEPACAVVYFSQQGECYSKDDVRTRSGRRSLRAADCYAIASGRMSRRLPQRLPAPVRRTRWIASRNTFAQGGARATFAIHVGFVASLTSERRLRVSEMQRSLADEAHELAREAVQQPGTVPTIVPAARQNTASTANSSQLVWFGKSLRQLDLLGKLKMSERRISV